MTKLFLKILKNPPVFVIDKSIQSFFCFFSWLPICISIITNLFCNNIETTLTGESRFHMSTPQGFEPVTLVAGSKQVSPLDQ